MSANNLSFGEITDIVARFETFETSDIECQMYRVGDCEAMIIVSCDANGNVLSAFCKSGSKIANFKGEEAKKISLACKQRSNAHFREQQKIESFNKRFR